MRPTAYGGHIVTAERFASTFGGRSARRRRPAPNPSATAAFRRWHAVCFNHRDMVLGGSGVGSWLARGESFERRCYICFRAYPRLAPVLGSKGCAPDTG